jgi:hypothetical protein
MASFGGLASTINLIAPAVGWWRGPVLPLASLTALRGDADVGAARARLPLAGSRSRSLALVAYCVILVLLLPATIQGDRWLLASGVLESENGYTIAHDVALAEVGFALPLAVYEWTRRRLSRGGLA